MRGVCVVRGAAVLATLLAGELAWGQLFEPEQRYAAGDRPNSAATADFNDDGVLDVVIANRAPFDAENGGDLSVFLGVGDGTLSAEVVYSAGVEPWSVAVGDLNGDGVADLVVGNGPGFDGTNSDLSVLLGNGDGTFAAEQRFATGAGVRSVALGDFDGDGATDVAVANGSSQGVSVLLGAGDGTLGSAQVFGTGTTPLNIAVGRLNGDSRLDIVTTNQLSGDVSVLLGNGDGGFAAEQRFSVGDTPAGVSIGDLDGDGVMDLAVANESILAGGDGDVSILIGVGNGSFEAEQRLTAGTRPTSVAVGDIDGDGVNDLVVANGSSDDLSVLLGTGSGAFSSEQRFGAGDRPSYVTLGDLDGDGALDGVVTNAFSDDVSVLLGEQGEAADLDGDGVVGSSDLGILLAAWGTPGTRSGVRGVGGADLDGDGVVGSSDLGILLAAWGG